MKAKLQALLKLVSLAFVLMASASLSLAIAPPMPFSKGTTWIYEGKVAWLEGSEVKSKRIRLATEIIETFNYQNARVALVRGFPSELTWYGDKQHPKYSLLILSSESLTEIETENREEARRLAQEFSTRSSELMQQADTIMAFPLRDGSRFRPRVKGFRSSGALMRYQEIYRSNPDHIIIDFVPGLGVVRYVYEHHGTASSVDVVLKEIRYGRSSDRKRRT